MVAGDASTRDVTKHPELRLKAASTVVNGGSDKRLELIVNSTAPSPSTTFCPARGPTSSRVDYPYLPENQALTLSYRAMDRFRHLLGGSGMGGLGGPTPGQVSYLKMASLLELRLGWTSSYTYGSLV
jgi:hypothetical protein